MNILHHIPMGIASAAMLLLALYSLKASNRARFRFFDIVYTSISRIEDQLHTLKWLSTELIAVTSIIFIVPLILWPIVGLVTDDTPRDVILFYLIALFCSGLADPFAEIIGRKFGKHKYATKGFFVNQTYYRTYEGSLAFFVISVGIAIFAATEVRNWSFAMALGLFISPFVMTFAEAKAPHTSDNPFIFISAYVLAVVVTLIHAAVTFIYRGLNFIYETALVWWPY